MVHQFQDEAGGTAKEGSAMSEMAHLLRQGWRNLWREKIVWLFALISALGSISSLGIIAPLFTIVGTTGVIYVASQATRGESVTLGAALRAVGRYFLRVTGFHILMGGVLLVALVAPCYSVIRRFPVESEIAQLPWMFPGRLAPIMFLAGILSAFYFLPLIEIVANGSGIRKSIASAWKLFTSHLGLWLRIGFLCGLILFTVQIIYWMMFIPWSSFDLPVLSNLNLRNPPIQPVSKLFFWLISIVDQFLFTYIAYVFTQAYYEKSNQKY
jgi:hypothetical protein